MFVQKIYGMSPNTGTQEDLLLYYIFKSSTENVRFFAEYLEKFKFSLK